MIAVPPACSAEHMFRVLLSHTLQPLSHSFVCGVETTGLLYQKLRTGSGRGPSEALFSPHSLPEMLF